MTVKKILTATLPWSWTAVRLRLFRPIEPCPDSTAVAITLDAPAIGEGTDNVPAMVSGRIADVASPRAAVVFDFDADVIAGDDRGLDGERPTRQARGAVQDGIGC